MSEFVCVCEFLCECVCVCMCVCLLHTVKDSGVVEVSWKPLRWN